MVVLNVQQRAEAPHCLSRTAQYLQLKPLNVDLDEVDAVQRQGVDGKRAHGRARRGTADADLTALSELVNLEHLELIGWDDLRDLGPLCGLRRLRVLTVNNCPLVQDLLPLSELVHLEELRLTSCYGVADLSPLASLQGLRYLNLGVDRDRYKRAPPLDLDPLLPLTRLRILSLGGRRLRRFSALQLRRGLTIL